MGPGDGAPVAFPRSLHCLFYGSVAAGDRPAIEVASHAGQQLLALIGDILDLLDRRTAAEFAAAASALDQLAAVPAPVTLRTLLPYPGVMLADDLVAGDGSLMTRQAISMPGPFATSTTSCAG